MSLYLQANWRADFDRLSPEQAQVVSHWGSGLAVSAGAGSGKTTTLVTKCLALLEKNPEARFIAVSFTEKSSADLREKLTLRLGGSEAISRHWVTTIHGLCGRIAREYPHFCGWDGEERMLNQTESDQLWRDTIQSLWLRSLPTEVAQALERLLETLSRTQLVQLLVRLRDLSGFGALESLLSSQTSSGEGLEATGPAPLAQELVLVARHAIERYQAQKKRRGGIDFSDLEAAASRVLSHPEVARELGRRFDLVLVDEFQDTNPLQAQVIWALARPDQSNLIVVGDPKQSIYRFRDADVSVFEEACSRLSTRLSLTRNFRSRPEILHVTERVCRPAFESAEMEFEALIPTREMDSNVAVDQVVERLGVTTPDDLAEWIQSQIAKGDDLGRFALLLRKIRGNEHWIEALVRARIPIALGSGGRFWEDPRVIELVAFIQWLDLRGNRLSGSVFLKAPWVGLSNTELAGLIARDPALWDQVWESDLRLIRALSPRESVLTPGERLLELLDLPQIEQEIGPQILALWHRCEDWSRSGMSFHEIALLLKQRVDESVREREVPPPKNQGVLQILTIHGSKGLEFDRVILVDFSPKPARATAAPLLFWDRNRGAALAQFDEEGERDSSHPIEKEFRAIENKKEVAESMRLLYVALTRARERLCLVELGPSEPMPEELYAREFWRGWMSVAGISKTEWKTESAQALRALGPEKRPKLEPVIPLDPVPMYRPRYSVTEWLELAQCERRFEWSRVRPRAVPPKQEGEREAEDSEIVAFNTRAESQSSSTQSASQRGTELHAELAALGKRFENWSTRSGTYALARYPALGAWIGKEKSRLAQDSEVSTFTEFGFEAMVGSELIAGTIDRFEVKTSGSVAHVRLIDYKLVGRGPFRERSDTEFAENYRIQLSLYAHAIRALMLGQARGEHVDLEISAELLLISQDGVRSVPVTLAPEVALLDLANRARVIVEGEAGVARPGTHCRYCPVAEICEQKKADD